MSFSIKTKRINCSELFLNSEYLFEESSFLNREPSNLSFMIGHHYLSFDLSLEKNGITGLSGYFNLEKVLEKSLNPIDGVCGRVQVVTNSFPLESGIAYDYLLSGESFYDPKQEILQIGELPPPIERIKISKNIILGLSADRKSVV